MFSCGLLMANSQGSGGGSSSGFGTGGKVALPGEFLAMVIQPDDKIVGYYLTYNPSMSKFQHWLIRYNSDGSIDNTFGTNGQFNFLITPGSVNYTISFMSMRNTGDFFVGIYAYYAPYRASPYTLFTVYLINAIGTTSSTWWGTSLPGGVYQPYTYSCPNFIAQPDGKIIFNGVRYNQNGTTDTSFNMDGSYLGIDTYNGLLNILTNGKIMQTSFYWVNRYNSDGSYDTGFHARDLSGAFNYQQLAIFNVAIYPNNDVLIALQITNTPNITFKKYLSNGNPVSTGADFNNYPAVLTIDGYFNGIGNSSSLLGIQSNNKIIMTSADFTNGIFYLGRYKTDGSLDS
jgi:uncharacterized delta-60 repeat protein